MITRLGYIFECGRDGADYQVCKHFLGRLNGNVQIVPRFMGNKQNLIESCGPVAAQLLEECQHVIIQWDLNPLWSQTKRTPCWHQDRQTILASLRRHKVSSKKVALICVEKELEAWLLADCRGVERVLEGYKHPHPVGNLAQYKHPDRISNPKAVLAKLFAKELGPPRKYIDHVHALKIAQVIPDCTRLRRVASFRRFAAKAAGVIL